MFDILKWLEDAPIRLVKGVGHPDTGGCWMSALSVYSGASWGDHPPCVDFTSGIGQLAIAINDMLPTDESRGRVIQPHILAPAGTVTRDASVIDRRRWLLVDAAVRSFAPHALQAAGLHQEARSLSRLPAVNTSAARAAAYAASAADAAIAAARAAALAAARAAAYAARAAINADDAAARAAIDAAIAAAYAAARAAARAAAYADDAAARAAAYAARAADAAYAARTASAAARTASAAAREHFARDVAMPVLLAMCEFGNTAPVEPACTEADMMTVLQIL